MIFLGLNCGFGPKDIQGLAWEHINGDKATLPRSKDAVAEQFRKLCKRAGVECRGFYWLRHCASTAVALVAAPYVQRRFM